MLTTTHHQGNTNQNHGEKHLTPVRWRRPPQETQALPRMGRKGSPRALRVGTQAGAATKSLRCLKKLNVELWYDPEIPFLVIYPKITKHQLDAHPHCHADDPITDRGHGGGDRVPRLTNGHRRCARATQQPSAVGGQSCRL